MRGFHCQKFQTFFIIVCCGPKISIFRCYKTFSIELTQKKSRKIMKKIVLGVTTGERDNESLTQFLKIISHCVYFHRWMFFLLSKIHAHTKKFTWNNNNKFLVTHYDLFMNEEEKWCWNSSPVVVVVSRSQLKFLIIFLLMENTLKHLWKWNKITCEIIELPLMPLPS